MKREASHSLIHLPPHHLLHRLATRGVVKDMMGKMEDLYSIIYYLWRSAAPLAYRVMRLMNLLVSEALE